MIEIILNDEFFKALEAINNDYYHYEDIDQVVADLIEDYLFREGGRLGFIIDGKYVGSK